MRWTLKLQDILINSKYCNNTALPLFDRCVRGPISGSVVVEYRFIRIGTVFGEFYEHKRKKIKHFVSCSDFGFGLRQSTRIADGTKRNATIRTDRFPGGAEAEHLEHYNQIE